MNQMTHYTEDLPLSGLNLRLSSSSTTSNFHLVVVEDDLKWVINEKKLLLLKQFCEHVQSKTPYILGD